MKRRSNELLKEIKSILHNIIYFTGVIDAAVLFLFLYLLCELMNLTKIVAIVIAVIYLVVHILFKLKKFTYKSVEDKFPILKEKLRTVSDTMNEKNIIVDHLRKDVLKLSRKIMTSSFINTKEVGVKVAFILILSFLIVFVTFQDIRIFDAKAYLEDNPLFRIADQFSGDGKDTVDIGEEQLSAVAGGGDSDEIFGEEKIAELGKKQVDLKIKLVNDQITLDNIDDAEEKDFEDSVFPSEMYTRSDASFESAIPKEHQELVKDYFSKLADKN